MRSSIVSFFNWNYSINNHLQLMLISFAKYSLLSVCSVFFLIFLSPFLLFKFRLNFYLIECLQSFRMQNENGISNRFLSYQIIWYPVEIYLKHDMKSVDNPLSWVLFIIVWNLFWINNYCDFIKKCDKQNSIYRCSRLSPWYTSIIFDQMWTNTRAR